MRTLLFILLLGTSTFAVGTSYWTQTNEADFKAGTLDNVVVSNLGDLKLSRAVKTLLEEDPRISSVSALAEAPDGTIYAGTGPRGVLLAISGEKVTTVAELGEPTHIFSLIADKSGAVLIGTGGEHGRVLRIDKPGDKPREFFHDDAVQYVWAMAQTADGNLYAATGPDGKLFEIKPDGASRVLLETDENNLLSLISDGKDLLYVGTDPHGLVYRVNRKTGESFVLYNAAESEIAALALDKNGNLYAATAEARDEGMPAKMPADQEPLHGGRPEGAGVSVPLPSNHPKEPSPAPPPNNDPGRPNPIPRSRSSIRSIDPRIPATFQMLGAGWRLMPVSLLAQEVPQKPKRRPPRPAPPPGPNPDPNPSPNPGPGNPQPAPGPAIPLNPATNPARHPAPIDTGAAGEARPEGNAVYRIDPEGFVTEVFRQDVLILAMVENNGTLLLAAGNQTEGQILQIRPDADETLVLASVDAKEILCLLPAKDGKIYLGMANEGAIATMTSGFAAKGTYTSPVLDATQISRFGKMQLHGGLPPGTTLTVSTRSGNVKEAQDKGWSKWSDEMPAVEFLQVSAPLARFLQYRLTLSSNDGKSTPVVEDVTIAYQIPNLPPRVTSIKIGAAEGDAAAPTPEIQPPPAAPKHPQANPSVTISWEATDPNNDALSYTLYFRRIGHEPWILLKGKLTDATFEWNTRTIADGRYEVRVVATDAAANPPGQGKTASRISDPVLIDNTPPVIGDLKWKQIAAGIQIDLKAVDRTSTVASVEYSIDSNHEWQFVLPVDGIYDSPEEAVSFQLNNLTAGEHQITVRATDVKGNQAFESVFVTIAQSATKK